MKKMPWNSRKQLRLILTGLLMLTAFGCVTTSGGGGKPSWVTQYPKDEAFYVGIGSSSSGSQAEDSELARARALNSLAAEISTEIRSSTSYREVDDGQGGVSRSAEEEINAVVAQNLQAVETMDSWYSPQDGAWYYVRLNKAQWAAIQQREMNALKRRVMDIAGPALNDPGRSLSEVLGALFSGWNLLAASPYAGMIRGELEGSEGVLLDLLAARAARELAAVRIDADPSEMVLEVGRPARLTLRVASEIRSRMGQLPLELASRAGEGPVIFTLSTSPTGSYSEPVSFQGLEVGKNYVTVRIGLETLGLNPSMGIYSPRKDLMVDLQQLKTRFAVSYGGDVVEPEALGGVEGSARAFFTGKLPVKIVDSGETGAFEIRFNLQYRSAPPNEYGLVIIYVKSNISVFREGKNLYTYETPEFKGGGLNWSQANTKALEKLFPALEEDGRFLEEIKGAFAFD